MWYHAATKKLALLSGDLLLLIGALIGIVKVLRPFALERTAPLFGAFGLTVLAFICSFYLANLYQPLAIPHEKNKIAARMVLAVCGALAATATLWVVLPSLSLGGPALLLLGLVMIPGAYIWRWMFETLFYRLVRPVRVLAMGSGRELAPIVTLLSSRREFELVGVVNEAGTEDWDDPLQVPVLGAVKDLVPLAEKYWPDMLVFSHPTDDKQDLLALLLECKMRGFETIDVVSLCEELLGKMPVEHVRDSWFLSAMLHGIGKTLYATRIKRVIDLLLAIVGLILSVPIAALTGLMIVLESGFPVLYKQRRLGLHGQEFWLFKFRSMRKDAEDETGAVWAKERDDRVTRVGRVIRILRVDEVPQILNVLKGEMSFVGPRPERPEFVEMLRGNIPYYSFRHTAKPGITGWAQVNYSYGASEQDALEKLQYDLYYLKNISLLLDLHILLRTIRVVVWGWGGR